MFALRSHNVVLILCPPIVHRMVKLPWSLSLGGFGLLSTCCNIPLVEMFSTLGVFSFWSRYLYKSSHVWALAQAPQPAGYWCDFLWDVPEFLELEILACFLKSQREGGDGISLWYMFLAPSPETCHLLQGFSFQVLLGVMVLLIPIHFTMSQLFTILFHSFARFPYCLAMLLMVYL